MYHDMLNELGHDNAPSSKGGGSSSEESGVLATSSTDFRNPHLVQRREVVNELKRCHEECDNMAALVKAVRLMRDLNSQFSFQEALAFAPCDAQNAADRALNALKGKISAAVQTVAKQADSLCATAEERDRFERRLERQFSAIRTKLIQDETNLTVEKARGLCERIEDVVTQLNSFGESFRENRELLGTIANSLRSYIRDSLGQAVVHIDVMHESLMQTGALPSEMCVDDFFGRLDTVIVEAYNSLRDHAAA
jgi:hypothetical protein